MSPLETISAATNDLGALTRFRMDRTPSLHSLQAEWDRSDAAPHERIEVFPLTSERRPPGSPSLSAPDAGGYDQTLIRVTTDGGLAGWDTVRAGLHEVFNEIGRDRVLDDLLTWFDGHLRGERG